MKAKNKGGRPPVVLTPEQIAQVEAMAGFLTVEQIADYLGIGRRTFDEVRERQPEVSAAYKKGRARALAGVGKGLLMRAIEGDNVASIFYLKTQGGWRETGDDEIRQTSKPADPRFSDDPQPDE
jgi:hypothetical protein